MSIHSRWSAKAVIERLEAVPGAGTLVLHWFSGSRRELERAAANGCWFSVGPAMLRSDKGRALAACMPRDRVLTESDGPFGQVDERPLMPWDVSIAESELANLWGQTKDETAAQMYANFKRLVS